MSFGAPQLGIPELQDALPSDYYILEEIAVHGQKAVFKCTGPPGLEALKVFSVGEDDANWARAERELTVMSLCSTSRFVRPGSLTLHEIAIGARNYGIYTEEYIDGLPLSSKLLERPFSQTETCRLIIHICEAISELYANNFVHRDVKPANIMRRTSDASFVLLDAGLALDLGDISLTAPGQWVGSWPYMSPEQFEPASKRDLDFRTDLFSLGIVAFELLSGVHPYLESENSGNQYAVSLLRNKKPKDLDTLCPSSDKDFCSLIMKMIATRRNMRARLLDQLISSFTPYLESA